MPTRIFLPMCYKEMTEKTIARPVSRHGLRRSMTVGNRRGFDRGDRSRLEHGVRYGMGDPVAANTRLHTLRDRPSGRVA
jgi:hypothetical protein